MSANEGEEVHVVDGTSSKHDSSKLPLSPNENEVSKDTTETTQTSEASKGGNKRSYVWLHFTRNDDSKNPRCVCNYCGTSYACNSKKSGTSNMRNHLENQCKKYPDRKKPKGGQKMLCFQKKTDSGTIRAEELNEGVFHLHSYDYKKSRRALAKMVICTELPFRIVEDEDFKEFCSTLEPRFSLPSRHTVARDCMKLFEETKDNVKSIMNGRRICLTTDTWTSNQNINYMCLTAHWIDDDWNLYKKILNFRQVANHKGITIGRAVENCLLNWGIDQIFTLTVDNASSNDLCIKHLKDKTTSWKSCILNHEFLHVRCCAHILNLIVRDGLKEENLTIVKIRNVIRYVRSSPSRQMLFEDCIKKEKIEAKYSLCLDVETRWNSTYLMLEHAIKFEKAFDRMLEDDKVFRSFFDGKKIKGPPSEIDWNCAKVFVKILRMFYECTLKFSGTLYVTSNAFFHELVKVHKKLMKMSQSSNEFISKMASNMKLKYDKYWDNFNNINYLLYIAVVLDPRYKMKYVAFCLKQLYGVDKGEIVVRDVDNALLRLFLFYEMNCPKNDDLLMDGGQSSRDFGNEELWDDHENEDEDDDDTFKEFTQQLKDEETVENQSEIARYLLEAIEPNVENFDILGWWKKNEYRYPCLSKMAMEVLAVPVSTVASESAFSTGGRVLDSYRSSLAPKTVEGLICTQNWLRAVKKPLDIHQVQEDIDKYEEIAEAPKEDNDNL